MITRTKKTLAQIIKEFFFGPVKVKAVKLEGTSSGVHFVPADQTAAKDLRELLGLNPHESPMIFGVAAFRGKEGRVYDVYARRRGQIIEALPVFTLGMKERGEWQPKTILNPFELEFEKVEGRGWSSRHPETGQHIKAFDVELAPDADGKARVHPGNLVLRPALTRTFWIIGQEGVVGRLTDNAIEVYDDTTKEDFSYAPYFMIMGRWRSPWECLGDPTSLMDVIELDRFTSDLNQMIADFERWVSRVLLPTIHPDRLPAKGLAPEKIKRLEEITDETRYQAMQLIGWVKRWTEHFLADLRLRRDLGMPLSKKLPQPMAIPGQKRKPATILLTALKTQDIENILFKPAKEPMVVKPKAQQPAKPAKKTAPTKEQRQAELASREGRRRKDHEATAEASASNGTAIGDLLPPTVKAKMEGVANNGPDLTKCHGCDDFVIVPKDWHDEIISCDQHDHPKGKKARKRLIIPEPVEAVIEPPKKTRKLRAKKVAVAGEESKNIPHG